MKPFVWLMNLARFFGFPFKCIDQFGYEFRRNKYMWLFYTIFQCAWIFLFLTSVSQIDLQNMEPFFEISTKLGMNWFDLFIDFFTWVISLCNILFCCYLLRPKYPAFCTLVASCNTLNLRIKPDCGKTWQRKTEFQKTARLASN